MRRTMMGILAVLLSAAGLAQATSVRIDSMGGVSICVRDLESDPVSLNPARAALVQRSGVVAGMRVDRSKTENTDMQQNDRLSGGSYISRTHERTVDSRDDALSGLVYLNLRENFTFGAYTSFQSYEDKTTERSGYNGRWEGNVAVSTRTYSDTSEDREFYSVPTYSFLAGYRIAGKYLVGAQYQASVPYDKTVEGRTSTSDHGYTASGDNSSDSTYMKREERNSWSQVQAGALLPVTAKSSLDTVIGISRERVTIGTAIETNYRSWEAGGLYVYDVNDILRCGCNLQYTQAAIDNKDNHIPQDDRDFKRYVFGLGASVTPLKALLAGMDIVYSRSNAISTYYGTGGGVQDRSDSTDEALSLRLGAEQWLVADKLVLRIGGRKNLYRESRQMYDSLVYFTHSDSHGRSTANPEDAFTTGFGWAFTGNVMVEYGLSAGSSTDHNLMATYYF